VNRSPDAMPFDLMRHAEGSSGELKPRPRLQASASSSFSASNQEEDERQRQALRALDDLAIKSSNKPQPAQPAQPVAPTPPRAQDPDADWVCRTCSKTNAEDLGDCSLPSAFKFCTSCGESKDGVASGRAPPVRRGDWDCPCGEACPASFLFCPDCGLPADTPPPKQTGSASTPPKLADQVEPGSCAGCGGAMPDSFKHCPDCGTGMGEAREGVTSLPSPPGNDWTCPQCGDEIPGSFAFCPADGSLASR